MFSTLIKKKKNFFFGYAVAYKSSQARVQIHTAGITRATAVKMPGPLPTEPEGTLKNF